MLVLLFLPPNMPETSAISAVTLACMYYFFRAHNGETDLGSLTTKFPNIKRKALVKHFYIRQTHETGVARISPPTKISLIERRRSRSASWDRHPRHNLCIIQPMSQGDPNQILRVHARAPGD